MTAYKESATCVSSHAGGVLPMASQMEVGVGLGV